MSNRTQETWLICRKRLSSSAEKQKPSKEAGSCWSQNRVFWGGQPGKTANCPQQPQQVASVLPQQQLVSDPGGLGVAVSSLDLCHMTTDLSGLLHSLHRLSGAVRLGVICMLLTALLFCWIHILISISLTITLRRSCGFVVEFRRIVPSCCEPVFFLQLSLLQQNSSFCFGSFWLECTCFDASIEHSVLSCTDEKGGSERREVSKVIWYAKVIVFCRGFISSLSYAK